jgi:hypothetical protein
MWFVILKTWRYLEDPGAWSAQLENAARRG